MAILVLLQCHHPTEKQKVHRYDATRIRRPCLPCLFHILHLQVLLCFIINAKHVV